ncbi:MULTISPECIES: FkbM family methyltransferase [Synechococcaceae]|uniref:FkbM family methyltransferase n=1 Tax=Synechococcaceae TaxID=1890426 RepID=UPI00223C46E0|nr:MULTISPECIES: FkbM family methyltransferase [Synechococcaceae]MCT4368287.1 FkbM family methyltransferase [Candidatus Regnicoccus frigidus MAG-AL2]
MKVHKLVIRFKDLVRQYARERLFNNRLFVDEVFSLEKIFILLRGHGVIIDTAVDIGANTGQWAKMFLRCYPQSRLLSIEANAHNLPELRRTNPNCLQACLGARTGEMLKFYLPNPTIETVNTGASLYRELQAGYDCPNIIHLETSTLDQFEEDFDLIKLDVQGAELDVLAGGTSKLTKAKLVMIEISLCQYNLGAPLGAEVISYLHEQGFFLLAVNEVLFRHGKPIQLDLTFARNDLLWLSRL